MTAAEQDSVRIMLFYPDVLVGNSHPLRLPQLVNTRWGGNRNINIFRNLSFLPSATNIDVSSRGRGDESLTGEPARHLNLDDVENIIQGECSADGGTEREERAARLIHSAREALQLNSCYVPDNLVFRQGINSFLFGVLFSLQLEELLHAKRNKK